MSFASQKRPAGLFRVLFFSSYQHFQAHGGFGSRKTRFRFKNKLLSLDTTVISLCLSLFTWAEFRRAKGGVKVHALLDHDSYMPVFVHILFADWTGRAVFFVTRQKSNAAYDVVETRTPPQNRNILSDDINA